MENVFLHTFISIFPQILFMAYNWEEIKRLIAQLNDNNANNRMNTVTLLGETKDVRVVPALIAVLISDSHDPVRIKATMALGEIAHASAVPTLIAALEDSSDGVQLFAAEALGLIGDASAVPALLVMLEDKNNRPKRYAAWALGLIGDSSSLPALIKISKDKDEELREVAAEALGRIGDASAVPALINILKDEDMDVRRHAAAALGRIAEKCKTIEEVERIEKTIIEASTLLRKGCVDKTVLVNAQLQVAQVLKKLAEKKTELAPKRDLLLPDRIKPPKKGGIYSTIRRIKNG